MTVRHHIDMERKYKSTMNVLILSGGSMDEMWAEEWIKDKHFDFCIAADRGLEKADRLGIKVDLLLGDYDSVDRGLLEKYRSDTRTITYPCEKDYTDTHIAVKKAIEYIQKNVSEIAENKGFVRDSGMFEDADYTRGSISIIGATGTRYDHAITNIFVMQEALRAGVECAIYDKFNKIYLKDAAFDIERDKQYGKYLSFAPISEEVTLSLTGVKYPLDRYVLRQGMSICQSNEITDKTARVDIISGKLVVFETND